MSFLTPFVVRALKLLVPTALHRNVSWSLGQWDVYSASCEIVWTKGYWSLILLMCCTLQPEAFVKCYFVNNTSCYLLQGWLI